MFPAGESDARLHACIVQLDACVEDALLKIEQNQNGFVIVLDDNGIVVGTVTDGDLRRQILGGATLSCPVSYNKEFRYLQLSSGWQDTCEGFNDPSVKFLPICDSRKKLVNVVTKNQFHKMLLHGLDWSPSFHFCELDVLAEDQEITNRPWGFYKNIFLSHHARSKIIVIHPGQCISLQLHRKREEHWVVIAGHGVVTLSDQLLNVRSGSYIKIDRNRLHRMKCSGSEKLIFAEIQLGDYFGEDDIIRVEDDYDRV